MIPLISQVNAAGGIVVGSIVLWALIAAFTLPRRNQKGPGH